MIKRQFIYISILVLLVFSSYRGLGLIGTGGIGRGKFNLLAFLQFISVILLVFYAIKSLANKSNFNDKLFKVFIALIVYLIIEFIISFFYLSINSNYSLAETLYYFTKTVNVLSIFVVISLIKSKKDIYHFYNLIILLSVISAIIAIIALFIPNLGLFHIVRSMKIGSEFRFSIPTSKLIVTGYFFLLAKVIHTKVKVFDLLVLGLLFLTVFMQLNRSTIILLTGFTVMALIFNGRFKTIPYILLFIFITYFVISQFLNDVGLSFTKLIDVLNYSIAGVKENSSSNTFIWRVEVLLNNLQYVSYKGHLFGIGYNWQPYSFIEYAKNHFVLSPTNDNAYANIVIVLGLPGIVIYYLIIKNIFGVIRKQTVGSKYVSTGIKYSLLYLLSITFFSNGILIGTETLIINLLFGLAYSYKQVFLLEQQVSSTEFKNNMKNEDLRIS